MYTVGGVTQMGSVATENIMEIPQKLRIDLPCGPGIPVMGICPMEIKIPRKLWSASHALRYV